MQHVVKLFACQYNTFKKVYSVRVAVECEDGHIANGAQVERKSKDDAEIDAMNLAGKLAHDYDTHVVLV